MRRGGGSGHSPNKNPPGRIGIFCPGGRGLRSGAKDVQMLRNPLPMISEELVMVIKAWGSVWRMKLRSSTA